LCNNCWNDPPQVFDKGDFMRSPRHKGTPRQFERTAAITSEQVKTVIRRIFSCGRAQRLKF
jgi:hypothetical protein